MEPQKKQNNQHSKNTKGYCYNKRVRKFQASFQARNEKFHLGYFHTEEEAHQAYLAAKDKYLDPLYWSLSAPAPAPAVAVAESPPRTKVSAFNLSLENVNEPYCLT